jgi:hypothetical protein
MDINIEEFSNKDQIIYTKQEINKTEVTEVINYNRKYDVGDHISYYIIDKENDIFIKSNGIIKKVIENNLFIVNNIDTNIYDKISYNNIINKVKNIDVFDKFLYEYIEYTVDNADILFLYILCNYIKSNIDKDLILL